ncbi:unnamed protein product, partial [Mesorhabditis spiculigera]
MFRLLIVLLVKPVFLENTTLDDRATITHTDTQNTSFASEINEFQKLQKQIDDLTVKLQEAEQTIKAQDKQLADFEASRVPPNETLMEMYHRLPVIQSNVTLVTVPLKWAAGLVSDMIAILPGPPVGKIAKVASMVALWILEDVHGAFSDLNTLVVALLATFLAKPQFTTSPNP